MDRRWIEAFQKMDRSLLAAEIGIPSCDPSTIQLRALGIWGWTSRFPYISSDRSWIEAVAQLGIPIAAASHLRSNCEPDASPGNLGTVSPLAVDFQGYQMGRS